MSLNVKDGAGATQLLETGAGDGGTTPFRSPVSAAVGLTNDAAASSDTGTFSIIALFKRALQNWTTLLTRVPAQGQAVAGSSLPVVLPAAQITTLTAPRTLSVTGTGAAVNDTPIAVTDAGDYRWVSLQLTGTFSATVVFEQSNDNVNWQQLVLSQLDSNTAVPVINANGSPRLYGGILGARYVRVRVSAYASGTVVCSAWLTAAPSPNHTTMAKLVGANGDPLTTPLSGDSFAASLTGLVTAAYPDFYNGTTWDRQRGNVNTTLLVSAARTATNSSADQTNYNGSGVSVILDVSVAGTGSITLSIAVKDSVSGNYVTILTGLAVTTVSTNRYRVYPGLASLANVVANDVLDRTWRVTVTHNNANTISYSVSACTML